MSEDPAGGKKYVALFREAEDQELRLDHPEQALAGYRRCYELPTVASLKALASSRMARCFQKLNRPSAAEQAYRTLLENDGDLRDLSHRPYALAAGFELEQTPARQAQLYRDLVRGRWELSAEQVEYFLSRLVGSEPVGLHPVDRCRTHHGHPSADPRRLARVAVESASLGLRQRRFS